MATDLIYYENADTTTVHGVWTKAYPLVTSINLGAIWLWGIRVRMPPGPCGNLGYAFYNADAQIIPYGPTDSWVIGDDEIWEWDYNQEVGVHLALWTWNSGSYDHELLVEVSYTPVAAASGTAPSGAQPAPASASYLLPQPNVFQVTGESVAG